MFFMQSCFVSTNPKVDYFDKATQENKKAEIVRVNVPVWLAKPFIKQALREEGESEDVIRLVKKLKKVKVYAISNGNNDMMNGVNSYLKNNKYQEWVSVKDGGDKVYIHAQQDGDIIKKLIIYTQSEKDFVVVDMKGKFSPDDIAALINSSSQN